MSDDHNVNYLKASKGFMSWAFTLDHKRIAILYMATVSFFFLLGGLFALGVRTELLSGANDLFFFKNFTDYNRAFTLHGAIMVFLFIIPGIPAILGNFVLPLMLGAKDVAFPKINLMSYHFYVVGAVLLAIAAFGGQGLDTGWTFYAPYSIRTEGNTGLATIAVFILGFSSIFTGLNFMATIHAMRPPQMTWFKMPLFLWGMYATALIQILATPVLGITLVLLGLERVLGIGIFDPLKGGDAVLFQHFFWFYSHPAVYIMILPGMAVMSELISTFSRKPVFGYHLVAYSSIGIAAVSFIVWGHHMFVSGQSEFSVYLFSLLTFLVGIPSAIKVFNWVATLYKGSISLDTPMIYALNFIGLFTIGGLTGLAIATLNVDIHLHDTYFVVSHFHYVMMGGTVMGFMGGIHYWWPKIWGRMYNEAMGRLCAVMVFVGFNLTFFPQFLMGAKGMPRRYATYADHIEEFGIHHILSTIGAYLLGFFILLQVFYLMHSIWFGRKAPKNPWGASTVEWQCDTPPVLHNFSSEPIVPDEPYVYNDSNKPEVTSW